VKFWDSSAIVPLLVDEPTSPELLSLLREDGGLMVWWGAPLECGSAIARREREGHLASSAANAAFARMRSLQLSWTEVEPSARVRDIALRILRTHSLRASDSLQLAAARIAAEDDPHTLCFVCLDERLALAAQREGFIVTG
jgi:predicted nucleic acid-binding protein